MFTHLHLHTDYSLLDGMGQIKQYVRKAKELGFESLAITDHGTAAGIVDFYNECTKAGIKPILGCEVYEAPESRFDKTTGTDDKNYYHLVLLVKNEIGYKNLCHIVSRSNTEGFYYKPRIDIDLLRKFHEGLVCLSACIAGRIPQAILRGDDKEKIKETILTYREIFGDDYYLEIQNHGIKDEETISAALIEFAKELGIKPVCTNDCHYVNSQDSEAHEWLLCVQTKKTINDADRMKYEGDYSLKSEKDMRLLFPDIPEAFDNTQEVADKCSFKFKFADGAEDYRMPKVVIPAEFNNDYYGYLESETYKGLDERYPEGHPLRNDAIERIKYELSVVKDMGFAEYFLDTRKTIFWAREHSIMVGPGRGSAAGSCMCYCLKITDIEPLRYNLLFERFLNPERISMPDIDVDYSEAHKEEVIASEAESNGKDKFSKIRTFGAMNAKGIVKDCLRVGGYPVSFGNELSRLIGDEKTLIEAYEKNPDIKKYINENGLEKVWDIALRLEGTKRNASTHACGHIPTPVPCEELFPVAVDRETGYLICEYNMTDAEHLGNLKKDLLMLRNLEIISVAHKLIRDKYGKDIPLWDEEILTDAETYELIADGDTDGIFQIESEGMKDFMKKLKPDCFEDIIAGVALYRPGPMDYIPDYIENKHNPEKIRYLTPELESILAPTYGVIVYQEQVMQIVQKLAGFTMGRADVVRKAMGKKKMEIMEEEGRHFVDGDSSLNIDGCVNRGIKRKTAETIYKMMQDFAKYAFNKSHAAAYAAITVQTAYLKKHYPYEFMAGLLSSVMDNTTKLAVYLNSCKKSGIKILKPDINKSDLDFTVEEDGIRYGLLAILGIGEEILKGIIEERNVNGVYKGITDIVLRNKEKGVKKNVIQGLIYVGALDFTGYSRKSMIDNAERLIKSKEKELKNNIPGQMSLFSFMDMEDKSDEIEDKGEYPHEELLEYEKKYAGLYLSGHPLDEYMSIIETLPHTKTIEFAEKENEEKIEFYGMITAVKKIFTKKKNEPMGFITIADSFGDAEGVVFPKVWAGYKDHIETGNKVYIQGYMNVEDDKRSVIVEKIQPMEDISKLILVFVKSKNQIEMEIPRIKEILSVHKGLVGVAFADMESKTMIEPFIRTEPVMAYSILSAMYGDDCVKKVKLKKQKERSDI